MKKTPLLSLIAVTALLGACDVKVNNPPNTPVVEKNTTIVNPPGPKTENNTTIVNPPATEKKTETNTTIVTPAKP